MDQVRRPAPWSPGYARAFYTIGVIPAAMFWLVALCLVLAGGGSPASWVLGGITATLASAGTGLWAHAARTARGMAPFSDGSYWREAYNVVARMEAIPELRSLSHETWQALSDASFDRYNQYSLSGLFDGLCRSAIELVHAAEAHPDAVASARRTKDLLDALRKDAEERSSS